MRKAFVVRFENILMHEQNFYSFSLFYLYE